MSVIVSACPGSIRVQRVKLSSLLSMCVAYSSLSLRIRVKALGLNYKLEVVAIFVSIGISRNIGHTVKSTATGIFYGRDPTISKNFETIFRTTRIRTIQVLGYVLILGIIFLGGSFRLEVCCVKKKFFGYNWNTA